MPTPIVTIANGRLNVQIGQWGFDYSAVEVRQALYDLSRQGRNNYSPDEVLLHVCREVLRQGADPRAMTNAQLRNFIQAMEF